MSTPTPDPTKCGYRRCSAAPTVRATLQLSAPDATVLRVGRVYLCARHLRARDKRDQHSTDHRIVLETRELRGGAVVTTPTPDQLRAAAGHLAKAVAEHDTHSHDHVRAAVEELTLNTREGRAISILSGWRTWYQDGPEGAEDAAQLVEWARWGMLLDAVMQEDEPLRMLIQELLSIPEEAP